MRIMHPDMKNNVLSKAVFSEEEEKVLGTVISVCKCFL